MKQQNENKKQVQEGCSQALKFLEKLAEGKITFAEVLTISMEEMYSVAQIGYGYLENGKLDDALTIFEGLMALNPYDPYFRTILGSIYLKKGNLDQAIAEYSFALESCKDDAETMANRGEAYFLAGEYQKALHDFESALARSEKIDEIRKQYLSSLVQAAKEKQGSRL